MQRLSIARAMMHDPQVLFLDEPSAGLDPQTRLLLWEIVREYNARGNTIVLTTHNMEEADDLCAAGRDRRPRQGRSRSARRRISRRRSPAATSSGSSSRPGRPSSLAALAALPGVTEVRPVGHAGADVYADRGGPLVPELLEPRRSQPARTSPTSTSPSRRSRTSFCTTRDGACGIEKDLPRAARPRRARRAAQLHPADPPDAAAADAARLRLRPRPDDERLHADGVQEPAAARASSRSRWCSSGIQAVAMPRRSRSSSSRKEIEDRLLAPIEIEWVAVEKILAGMIQALVAGPRRPPGGVAGDGPRRRPVASRTRSSFAVAVPRSSRCSPPRSG